MISQWRSHGGEGGGGLGTITQL